MFFFFPRRDVSESLLGGNRIDLERGVLTSVFFFVDPDEASLGSSLASAIILVLCGTLNIVEIIVHVGSIVVCQILALRLGNRS